MESSDRIDRSTGLFPQRMLETLLAHEVNRSRRYLGPVSLLHIAIHYFSNPPPEVVESAQSSVAHLLNANLREADLPGVYNGNFLVVLPATGEDGARAAAERLIGTLSPKQVLRNGETYEISICIGIVSHPGGEGISTARLLAAAPRALVQAQKDGPGSLASIGGV